MRMISIEDRSFRDLKAPLLVARRLSHQERVASDLHRDTKCSRGAAYHGQCRLSLINRKGPDHSEPFRLLRSPDGDQCPVLATLCGVAAARQLPAGADKVAGVAGGIALEIVLMLRLR